MTPPPDNIKRKITAEWLRKADEDLELAEHLLTCGKTFPNAIALHSQQAVEKYLKAFLTWHQKSFPKTHDLDALLSFVETIDSNLAESLQDVIAITPYGVELRYPSNRPDATPEEARQAVDLALMSRDAVRRALPSI